MGLDIGLSKAGLNVVIGQDFEPACVETMKANGHKVLGGDIRNIEPETMLQLSGLHEGEPFLIEQNRCAMACQGCGIAIFCFL